MVTVDHDQGVHVVRHHDISVCLNVAVVRVEILQVQVGDASKGR